MAMVLKVSTFIMALHMSFVLLDKFYIVKVLERLRGLIVYLWRLDFMSWLLQKKKVS